MSALLQMTMETEDTTERLRAPTVPSWNFSPPTPISADLQTHHHRQADEGTPPEDQNFPIKPPESRRPEHLQPRNTPVLISKPHQQAPRNGSRPVRPTAPVSAREIRTAVGSGRGGRESGQGGGNGGEICVGAGRDQGGGARAPRWSRESGTGREGDEEGWLASLLFLIWLVGRRR
jgi:hypothetical protein